MLSAAASARADTEVDRAAAAIAAGEHVYQAPDAVGHPLSKRDVSRIANEVAQAATPISVAVLGEPHSPQATADIRELIDRVRQDGTYVVVGTRGFVARS